MAFVLLLAVGPGRADAQDSQYWTLQYGPVAELLGGVVVGSSRDLSATFYNPGALALTKDPSLLASVESFEATRLKADSVPPTLNFSDSSVRPSPTLFAFALPRSLTGSHTWAISSLTRQDLDLRVDNWQVVPSGQGGAESLFDQSLTENWFGLSWAHGVGGRSGLGLTTYVVYRGQRTRREISGQAALSPTDGGAALLVEDFDYCELPPGLEGRFLDPARFLGRRAHRHHRERAGVRERIGLLHAFGGGRRPRGRPDGRGEHAARRRARVPLRVALVGGGGRGLPARQELLPRHRGVVRQRGRLRRARRQPVRAPMPPPPASSSASSRRRRASSTSGSATSARSSERFSYYAAFTTDFTFAEKDDAATNSLSTWDIYHVTAGASIVTHNVKLTMGAAYAFGSDERSIATLIVPPGGRARAHADAVRREVLAHPRAGRLRLRPLGRGRQ